jgi:putative acetyltransferase
MKNSKILVRTVKISDMKQMQKMFVDTISVICKNDYSSEEIRVWTSSVENTQLWINRLTSQYFLVAELDNQIVGYASLEKVDYLDFLYVHKNFQRQGIANMLFSKIEQEAINRQATTLNSDVSLTARPFFEKMGFKVLETQRNIMGGVEIINYKMNKQL